MLVPVIAAAQLAGHQEHRRREAVPGEHRKRMRREVGVSVVEGDADQPGGTATVRGIEQLSHRRAAQSAPPQPFHLLLEAGRRDGDAVWVVTGVDRVVHQHQRVADLPACVQRPGTDDQWAHLVGSQRDAECHEHDQHRESADGDRQ